MARGMWTLRLACVALASLGSCCSAWAQSLTRPGRAVENESFRGLSVSVKAWPNSKSTGKDGNCPLYGDAPLDSATSGNDGNFKLSIAKDKKTYTVVYCQSQYVPRVDRDLPNSNKDGTAVIPIPAVLFPTENKADTALQIDEAVKRRIVASFNDLAYLRTVNPEIFEKAVSDLSRDIATSSGTRAGLVNNFARAVQAWQE